MRSVIKIWLAVEAIIKAVLALILIIGAIEFLIISFLPQGAVEVLAELNLVDTLSYGQQLRSLAVISAIIGVIFLLSAFIAYRAIIRLNKVGHKYQLIPAMIGLLFLSSPIIALLMMFTPRKYIVYKYPYFE